MIFDEVGQHRIKIRPPNFLQVLVNPGVRFFDFDNSVQIDGGGDDHGITLRIVDGGLNVF